MFSRFLLVILLNLLLAFGHPNAVDLSPLSQLRAIYKLSKNLNDYVSGSKASKNLTM